jgi:hypothetical protein
VADLWQIKEVSSLLWNFVILRASTMEELVLYFTHKGLELELPLRSYAYGYTYRLEVKVGEDSVIFEPDEEGSYRAFADEKLDKGLLAAIAAQLEKLK